MTDIAKSFIPDDAMLFTYRELAGFYDVDGSFFTKIKHTSTSSYYETLRMFQKSFGGIMTKTNVSNLTKPERNRYISTLQTMENDVLLPAIKDHLVLKAETHNFDRINIEYVRGLFCAVGNLKTFGLTLTHEYIDHVKAYIDKDVGVSLGKITGKEWLIPDHKGMKIFLDWMTIGIPRLFNEEKAKAIDGFYRYLETKDPVGMKRGVLQIPDKILKTYTDLTKDYTSNLRAVAL